MLSNQSIKPTQAKTVPAVIISLIVFAVGMVLSFSIYNNLTQISRPLLLGFFTACNILAGIVVYTMLTSQTRAAILAGQLTGQLRISEEKYRQLVENIPSVVFTFDQSGNPVFVSGFCEKIFNLSPEEIYQGAASAWFSRINPEHKVAVKNAMDDLFAGRRPLDVEYQMKKKDGSLLWVRQRSSFVFDRDGKKFASGLLFDNTQLKLALDELSRRTSDLEKINSTMIGREVRMSQLKKENEELKKKLDFTSFIKGEEGN